MIYFRDMDKETSNVKMNRILYILVCIYPITMIGAYLIGWKSLFYIGVLPLLGLCIINIVGKFKYGSWIFAILPALILLIVSEIGYIVTNSIIDGICFGVYSMILVGVLGLLTKSLFKNKENTLREV